MPINEPISNRRIAPASLAFERLRGGTKAITTQVGTVPSTITYQTNVIVNSTAFFNTEFSDSILDSAKRDVMVGVANTEMRSKAAVGQYHRAFYYTSDNGGMQFFKANNAFGAITAVQAPTEVIAVDGARTVPSTPSPNTAWLFRATQDHVGVWWMYCHTEHRFEHNDELYIIRLCLYKNGALWGVVDVLNADGSKHGRLGVVPLRGGLHVPLQTGDRVQWVIAISSKDPGTVGAVDGTCYFAAISGHRESCEYREVNAPTTASTFNAATHNV
jgi:hypothetical protein